MRVLLLIEHTCGWTIVLEDSKQLDALKQDLMDARFNSQFVQVRKVMPDGEVKTCYLDAERVIGIIPV